MQRSRLVSFLVFAAIILVCLVLPRMYYSARIALIELRYAGLFLLLLGGFVWLLLKIGGTGRR